MLKTFKALESRTKQDLNVSVNILLPSVKPYKGTNIFGLHLILAFWVIVVFFWVAFIPILPLISLGNGETGISPLLFFASTILYNRTAEFMLLRPNTCFSGNFWLLSNNGILMLFVLLSHLNNIFQKQTFNPFGLYLL